MKTRSLMILLLGLVLLLPRPGAAQEGEEAMSMPLTWVSFVEAKPGMGDAVTRLIAKGGAEIYDPMMADGRVLTWGVGQPINHWPDDDWTHAEWVTFRDWGAVNDFVESFMASMMSKSEEQRKAEQQEWMAKVVAGSHYDSVNRHLVVGPGDTGRPSYINLAFYKAKRGKSGEVKKIYEEYGLPVMEGLQAEGVVGSFGLYTAELHGDHGWTHVAWYTMPGLGSRDAVHKAFDAAEEARSEEAQKDLMKRAEEAFEPESHHDRILAVTHYGGASVGGGEKEGGDGEDGDGEGEEGE